MFLILLPEEGSRVVGEKVWCSPGYLCRKTYQKLKSEISSLKTGIYSAFSPSLLWSHLKATRNDKQKGTYSNKNRKEFRLIK